MCLIYIILTSSDCGKKDGMPSSEENILEPIELKEIKFTKTEFDFKANTCSYENSVDSIMIDSIGNLVNLKVAIEFEVGEPKWLLSEDIDMSTGKIQIETMVENLPKGNYTAKIILNADNAEAEKTIAVKLEVTNIAQSFGGEEVVGKVIFNFDFEGTPPNNFKIPYDFRRFFSNGTTLAISDLGFSLTRSDLVKEVCWPIGDYRITFNNFDNCRLLIQSRFEFTVKEDEVRFITLKVRCT